MIKIEEKIEILFKFCINFLYKILCLIGASPKFINQHAFRHTTLKYFECKIYQLHININDTLFKWTIYWDLNSKLRTLLTCILFIACLWIVSIFFLIVALNFVLVIWFNLTRSMQIKLIGYGIFPLLCCHTQYKLYKKNNILNLIRGNVLWLLISSFLIFYSIFLLLCFCLDHFRKIS